MAELQLKIFVGRVTPAKASRGAKRRLKAQMAKEGFKTAKRVAREAKRLAKRDLFAPSGAYRQSIRAGVQLRGDVVRPLVTIGVKYASFVERGRGPGGPTPVKKLIPWVRRAFGLRGKAARSRAFAISRKHAERGWSRKGKKEKRGYAILKRAIKSKLSITRRTMRTSLIRWRRVQIGV